MNLHHRGKNKREQIAGFAVPPQMLSGVAYLCNVHFRGLRVAAKRLAFAATPADVTLNPTEVSPVAVDRQKNWYEFNLILTLKDPSAGPKQVRVVASLVSADGTNTFDEEQSCLVTVSP